MQPPPPGSDQLSRLTTLSQELAGAFRPATIVELLARALTEQLAPDRLSIMLLDADANTLRVAYHHGPRPATTDEPLLQLALRRGPLVFPTNVAKQAQELGVTGVTPEPGSWLGAPIAAVGRTLGATTIENDRAKALNDDTLVFVRAALAQAAIALENARLVELLSSGKREWEQTVDAINQAICYVDPQGTVRRANRVFADLIKLPVTALPGRPWLTLLPPAWTDSVSRLLTTPAGTTAAPVEVRAGERILLVTSVRTGEPGAAVLVFEDQTEKRRLQEQLLQSEKMSAIGQLIAGVAHDLNNPLASVVGFSDLLGEASDVPPRLAEPLAVIRQEAERASNIVRNLLSFARRQEGERQIQPLRPIIESTLGLLKNELMGRKIEATLEVERGAPDVEVHANQIKQVFVNIINNAAQAIASTGRPGGKIAIAVKRYLDGVAVSITDNGPGIPEAVAARVFEPFFTTKGEREGTGLGLSICQGIVKEHGGRITLDAGPGPGATFTVELPESGRARIGPTTPGTLVAAEGAPPPPPAPPPAEAAATTGRLRILVVDDEPHILHYMQATLQSWGHDVDLAHDGSQALKRALTHPFDLIICDLRMPRLGGREMYRTLAQMHPTVADRIIFATGDTVRGDTLQFLEELGRPFLHKPFKLDELRRVLAAVAKAPA